MLCGWVEDSWRCLGMLGGYLKDAWRDGWRFQLTTGDSLRETERWSRLNWSVSCVTGAFLIAYFTAMVFCGIPIFFQEVALGQYLGVGGMTLIGQLVPIMKGVGFATMVVVLLIDIYYTIIIAWTLFYFVATFTALPDLPWAGCSTYTIFFSSLFLFIILILSR